MNIHFTDVNILNKLNDSSIFSFEFGSVLYGLNDHNSDKDFIHVYAPSEHETSSFLWEPHAWQYKDIEANEDHIYMSLELFIRNLINGDMPALLEVIHEPQIENTVLGFLYQHRKEFYTFQNIRAYLGYAKRDVTAGYSKRKRLCHGYRCEYTARQLIAGDYENLCHRDDDAVVPRLKYIKYGSPSHQDIHDLCDNLLDSINASRKLINNMYQDGKLHKILDMEFMKRLDEWILSVRRSDLYITKQERNSINFDDLELYYNTLENGVLYK